VGTYMVAEIENALLTRHNLDLTTAFDIKNNEVISLVGGGGKTTLMFALAREIWSAGGMVITTTTTRIASSEPCNLGSPKLILENDQDRIVESAGDNLKKYGHITIATQYQSAASKLKGINPDTVDRLAQLDVAYIIVEADGAARKPAKAPNATEPVIPQTTTLLIPVIGIDVMNKPLTGDYVFRAEIAAEMLGVPIGERMTAKLLARLLIHDRGITKNAPETARIIPFINKLDIPDGLFHGRNLAHEIIAQGNPRIKKVVLGQVALPEHIIEIFQ
jgi:probable selenium-dependent hydroxylase accessory protein YqeC